MQAVEVGGHVAPELRTAVECLDGNDGAEPRGHSASSEWLVPARTAVHALITEWLKLVESDLQNLADRAPSQVVECFLF